MTGWIGGVEYRLLPVFAGLAFFTFVPRPASAAEISLSDLRGYSIEAEWFVNSRSISVGKSGERQRTKNDNRYVDKIYISKTVKIFHRRIGYCGSCTKPEWNFDFFRSGRSQGFKWANSTFVHTAIPSADKERTTYVQIDRIALSQSNGSYSCSVTTSLALQKGEKQYIKYEPSGLYRIIQIFRSRQKSCRVFKGNVLKGEVGP